MQMLNLKEMPKYLDATDGLAAAVCHGLQNTNAKTGSHYSTWESFVKNNTNRIK